MTCKLKLAPAALACLGATALHAAPDPAPTLPRVEVVGNNDARQRQPGSASVIDAEELQSSHVISVSEALRKVPGVVVRDEEGFGLRPNIGIRGLNPTRSTKVLLLEDGLPAAYAPYGDNSSYYHAPVDRYERIEVMKGVGMLRFGPQTVGGVVNYLTPDAPEEFGGKISNAFGSRDYGNAHLQLGGGGALLDVIRKQGAGSRDTLKLQQTDINAKFTTALGDAQALTLRGTWLNENSQVGYSGLTEAEFQNFGARYGFDQNARFLIDRYGLSLSHSWQLNDSAELMTSAYGYRFERAWWRQSSTTTDTQCGTAFRDARLRGERVDFDSCLSSQGRVRAYDTTGVESRLRMDWTAFGAPSVLEFGAKIHSESQERRQINTTQPRGRIGTLVENNRRETDALAAFIGNRFEFGALDIWPIVRIESIDYTRSNRLAGVSGDSSDTVWVPGVGINWRINDKHSLFAGAHRGFAPARAEDVIDNGGGSTEVEAEDSRNLELGLRGDPWAGVSYEMAAFSSDFLRQVSVGSIAGGSTPLAQSAALYQGLELAAFFSREDVWMPGRSYANVALTWLPVARQESAVRAVVGGGLVGGSAPGKRMPYAPKHAATVRVGQSHGAWDGSVELAYVGRQFADFSNQVLPTDNGQLGEIASYTLLNLSLNYAPEGADWNSFVALKNATDRTYIADRTRGIQVGPPRSVQVGLSYRF